MVVSIKDKDIDAVNAATLSNKSYLRRIKDKFDVRELKTNEDFKEWNQGNIPVAITHKESSGHTSWK